MLWCSFGVVREVKQMIKDLIVRLMEEARPLDLHMVDTCAAMSWATA